MKVIFPKRYEKQFRFALAISRKRVLGDHIEIECPVGFDLDREFERMCKREFVEMYKSIKVKDGYKGLRGDRIVITPRKTTAVSLRIAPSELELIKKASKEAGETLTEYLVGTALGRAIREISATREAQRNPR